MARLGCTLLIVLLVGCATQVHRSHCTCTVNTPDGSVQMEQETHEFKKRPILDRVVEAIGGLFGLIGL